MAEETGRAIELATGVRLFAELRGDGPPVIFVGGLGDDHTLWAPLIGELGRSYRYLVFDNRGAGRSGDPGRPHAISTWAEDAHLLAEAVGMSPAVLVGCSMGGAIVQEWALRHPRDAAALVLISTWSTTDARLADTLIHWSSLSSAGEERALLESMVRLCASPEHLRAHPDFARELLAAPAPPRFGFLAQARACLGHDTRDRLGAIRVPTLVVCGTRDYLVDPYHAQQLTAAIPGATLSTVDAGHVPFWERPGETAEIFDAFVAGVGGQDG
jgi:pimeloyl-ACP methyl ester carboxylesterase